MRACGELRTDCDEVFRRKIKKLLHSSGGDDFLGQHAQGQQDASQNASF